MLNNRENAETEVHRFRVTMNWDKAVEKVHKLIPRHTDFTRLVEAECSLEKCIEENSFSEELHTSLLSCKNAEKSLLQLQDDDKFHIDAKLLYAKFLYVDGRIEECLSICEENLEAVAEQIEDLPEMHQLRAELLLAEAYALKGLSTEKVSKDFSRSKFATMETNLLKCFARSSELAMHFFTETARIVSTLSEEILLTNQIVEIAMQRAPIFFIKKGDVRDAIILSRQFLISLNLKPLQPIRQDLIRSYADMLIRHVRTSKFLPFSEDPNITAVNTSQGTFVPNSVDEEIFLLLLLSESTANNAVILNRSREYTMVRELSENRAFYVIDLITLFCMRIGQYDKVIDSYSKAMKYSFQNARSWFAFGLSLMSNGHFHRAYLVFKECLELKDCDKLVYLLLAKISINHFGKLDEALEFCDKALEFHCDESRVKVMMAVIYLLKARQAPTIQKRASCLDTALNCVQRSKELELQDPSTLFYDTLIHAERREMDLATAGIEKFVNLFPDDKYGTLLALLVLTAQERYTRAMTLINDTYHDFHGDLSFLKLHALIKMKMEGVNAALSVCKETLMSWKVSWAIDGHLPSESSSKKVVYRNTQSVITGKPETDIILSIRGILDPPDPLCECFASSKSFIFEVLLFCAELYIEARDFDEADRCVKEAAKVIGDSPKLMLIKGSIEECKKNYEDAIIIFTSLLALVPLDVQALKHLAFSYFQTGDLLLAEKCIRDAIGAKCFDYECWSLLGEIFLRQSNFVEAESSFRTAMMFESSCPILPYETIFRPI